MTSESLIQPSKGKLWLAAIKPPMYSVAVIPITVGTAAAYSETNIFNQTIYGIFLISAILIIAWINLSNDVFDSETGIDKNKSHSVVNLTGNKSLVFWLSNFCLGLGILGILAIALLQQDLTTLGLIILACALGYTYQGPPFRLGYQGLGEFICFIAFGPVSIAAVYYSQAKTFTLSGLAVSVIIGITTSIILFCSHFHQVEDDLAAGKRSPIVRLGTARGATVLAWSTWSIFLLTVVFVWLGAFPWWSLLIFGSLPFAYQLVSHVQEYHAQPDKVNNCKFLAVNLHFISGLLFSLGLALPNLFHP